ncbi:DUF6443 domain-containing protein [Dyadobacter sp. CY261]|uniref:DUF6443 domain-containing protein n=1 Tax=Dyadobacter sp. CY261 TaxID=2907203 RepID=UPI001F314B21|nr:DUF6443 domain-containing protein [Dyadobacter sp. CY261]MCF0073694.1 DUF6443 domain-containing protein [Dyadobacter sp. CY261]
MKHTSSWLMVCMLAQITGYAQQTNARNYILQRTYKQSGANADDVGKVTTQVHYFDGLGRPAQTVTVAQSPAGQDFVEPLEYDAAGRIIKKYLPYAAAGNRAFHGNGTTEAVNWYNANTAGLSASDLGRPFQETFYEPAPTGRVSGERAPGNKSSSSVIKQKVNTLNQVNRYDYDPLTNTIVGMGMYAPGTLTYKNITDEQGNVTNEFTDLLGQVICRQVIADAGNLLSTYYIYDDAGLLRGVLQPNYQDVPSLTDNAFTYDYDERGRMTVKRVPGGGVTELVYDQYNRLAVSRNANQLARGVWGFIKYDALDRPVVTGEIVSNATLQNWAIIVDANTEHHEERSNGTVQGYTLDKTAPKNAAEANLLTITFYDDYTFSKPANMIYNAVYYPSANANVKGQVTGTRARMLPGNGATGGWLTSVTHYDAEYRSIQISRELYDLGASSAERISNQYKYDLAPVLAEQKTEQFLPGNITHSHTATFQYDHADRLLSIKEKIMSGNKTKEAFTTASRYNTLGQRQSQWFHSTDNIHYLRKTNFTNNIRGWQTEGRTVYKQQDNSPEQNIFGYNLSYANGNSYTNGNISQMQLLNKNDVSYTKGLNFAYDGASRMTGSTGMGGYADTEAGITYDKNGNLKTLVRAGTAIDNLTYTYLGNRLSAINDGSGSNLGVKSGGSSYGYDGNGNMTSDGNRGATLAYNYLNLPKTVTLGAKTATYDYDAFGNKHKYAFDTLTMKYAGHFQYRQVGNVNNLYRVSLSEGQAVFRNNNIEFEYYLKDHLGNVRLVFDDKGQTLQRTDYYPFGLEIDRNNPTQQAKVRNGYNRYLFNGIERQLETGIYQAHFRGLDPAIGRWMQIDPKPDLRMSLYVAMSNNPIRYPDPLGDTTILNNKGVVQRQYGGDNIIYQQEKNGNLTQIGEFGKSVNLNGILSNVMRENKKDAKMMGALGFANAVRPGGKWDYKDANAQKGNIFGAVARYEDVTKDKTSFTFGKLNFVEGGADVGNYNYGYTGRNVGGVGYSPITLWGAAGILQTGKDLLQGEIRKALTEFGSMAPIALPPFGDEADDFIWVTTGMTQAGNEKKNNN